MLSPGWNLVVTDFGRLTLVQPTLGRISLSLRRNLICLVSCISCLAASQPPQALSELWSLSATDRFGQISLPCRWPIWTPHSWGSSLFTAICAFNSEDGARFLQHKEQGWVQSPRWLAHQSMASHSPQLLMTECQPSIRRDFIAPIFCSLYKNHWNKAQPGQDDPPPVTASQPSSHLFQYGKKTAWWWSQ